MLVVFVVFSGERKVICIVGGRQHRLRHPWKGGEEGPSLEEDIEDQRAWKRRDGGYGWHGGGKKNEVVG